MARVLPLPPVLQGAGGLYRREAGRRTGTAGVPWTFEVGHSTLIISDRPFPKFVAVFWMALCSLDSSTRQEAKATIDFSAKAVNNIRLRASFFTSPARSDE
jgi:hypothetical protein